MSGHVSTKFYYEEKLFKHTTPRKVVNESKDLYVNFSRMHK